MVEQTGKPVEVSAFWGKLRRCARVAGREVIEKALWLFYAAQSPQTPTWAKSIIYGALAYFIMPMDTIPDFVPGAGFSDDLGALAAALLTIAPYVDENVRVRAR